MVGCSPNNLKDPTVNGFQIDAMVYHLFLSCDGEPSLGQLFVGTVVLNLGEFFVREPAS
jgi:hypothetical protein